MLFAYFSDKVRPTNAVMNQDVFAARHGDDEYDDYEL